MLARSGAGFAWSPVAELPSQEWRASTVVARPARSLAIGDRKREEKNGLFAGFFLFSIIGIDAAQHTPAPAYRPR